MGEIENGTSWIGQNEQNLSSMNFLNLSNNYYFLCYYNGRFGKIPKIPCQKIMCKHDVFMTMS